MRPYSISISVCGHDSFHPWMQMHEWLLVWFLCPCWYICRRTASTVLRVPLLAHRRVISPCPAMFMPVCVRASCCCGCRLPFVCAWPAEDNQLPKTGSAEWGKEAWRSWGEDRKEDKRDEKTFLELRLKVQFAKIICFYVDDITIV